MSTHEQLNIAISTASVVSTDTRHPHRLLIPSIATLATFEHLRELADVIRSNMSSDAEVTLSHHPMRVLNNADFLRMVEQAGLRISSFDMPEIQTAGGLIRKSWAAVTEKSLGRAAKETKEHLGWFLVNQGDRHSRNQAVEETLRASATKGEGLQPFVIRVSMEQWENDPRLKRTVLNLCTRTNRPITLAFEPNPYGEKSLEDFWTSFVHVSEDLKAYTEIAVRIDFDFGKFQALADKENDTNAINELDKILANPIWLKKLQTVSLSPAKNHAGFLNSMPAFEVIAFSLGRSIARGNRTTTQLIVESHPTEREEILRHPETFAKLQSNFVRGRSGQ